MPHVHEVPERLDKDHVVHGLGFQGVGRHVFLEFCGGFLLVFVGGGIGDEDGAYAEEVEKGGVELHDWLVAGGNMDGKMEDQVAGREMWNINGGILSPYLER